MKEIYLTILNIIKNFLLKNLFYYIKNRRDILFIIQTTMIFFLADVILTLPVFIIRFKVMILAFAGILFLSKAVCCVFFYLKYRNKLEQINNDLLNNNMILTDFTKYLSNDWIFCINVGIVSVFAIFLYQCILYAVSLLFNIQSLSFYLNTLFVYFTVLLVAVFGILYFNYAVNKKNKKIIVKFEDYEEFHKYGIFMTIIYFVCFYIIQFVLLKLISGLHFMTFLYPIPLATFFSIGLNTILDACGIYKRINLAKISVLFENTTANISRNVKEKKFVKALTYLKFLLPVVFYLICRLVLSLCYRNIPNVSRLAVIQSLIFACFAVTFLLNKNSYTYRQIKSSFNFSNFVYLILFIITFSGLKPIEVAEAAPVDTKTLKIADLFGFFVTPIINLINFFYKIVHNLYETKFALIIFLIPIGFVATFFFARLIIFIVNRLKIYVDNMLMHNLSRQDANIIYSDSISFFYFLTSLLINLLIIILLRLECPAFANFFIYLFDVFQVSSIFKLTFLTAENITKITNLIINIVIVIIALRVVFQFLSSLLSHFVLFADEIVYLENKLYNNTVLRIPLQKINYIIVKQNIVEKFLDIGTIYIETQDKNGLIKINGISGIKQKSIILMEKIKIDLQKI